MSVLQLSPRLRAPRNPVAVLLTLTLALLGASPAAGQEACPAVVPIEELVPGARATGLTVVHGTEPVRFGVEVLGVLVDGRAPGRDVIVVDTFGAAIDEAGGVWSGMSGSPVYLGDPTEGRLIGAVAYSFSEGASSVAGLTPAEDLLELLRDGATVPRGGTTATPAPATTGAAAVPDAAMATAGAAAVPEAAVALQVRERVAEVEPAAVAAGGGLRRLPTPLAVSGLARRGTEVVQDAAERAGLEVLVTPGGTGTTAAAGPPVAGGNFAGVLSIGDVTSAIIGTTTVVCEGRAVALAHEFTLAGDAALSANVASAVAVVDDPAKGPFKLANVGAAFGTLDADRWAGVRATLGDSPATIPVRSTVTAADRGVSREGSTGVVRSRDLPLTAGLHLVGNLDSVGDRIGGGSASLQVRIEGRAADGTPFTYERGDLYTDDEDISSEVALTEQYDAMVALLGGLGATFTNVDYHAEVRPEVRRYTVAGVRVAAGDDEPVPVGEAPVPAVAGGALKVRVALQSTSGEVREVDLRVPIPVGVSGGTLLVSGGGDPGQPPVPDGEVARPAEGDPVAAFVAELEARPSNAELSVTFQPYETSPPSPTEVTRAAEMLDQVVTGGAAIPVAATPAPFEVREVLGPDRVGTAAALSADTWSTAGTVVLARADGYADALAAAPLAASLAAPILLTDAGALREEIAAEIRRLGASEAVLLGGAEALSESVADALRASGLVVRRVAGADRFDTARLIAAELGGGEVYVTQAWPDALSLSPLAAAQRRPILLVESTTVPAATSAALGELGATGVTIVGGEASVAPAVAAALAESATVERVAGADRYATSLAVAERSVAAGARLEDLTLATGRSFPDALAAGPAVAAVGGVLLLLDGEAPGGSPGTYAYLSSVKDAIDTVRLLGGPAAITPDVRAAVTDALH